MKKRIRLYNFLIDALAIFLCLVLLSLLLVRVVSQENMRIVGILLYYVYYFVMELTFGQTLGKMLTKTIVVSKENESAPSLIQVLLRTLSRLIPIDFITYFFDVNGLHDYLSQTKLITKS